jgi:hypothetical protein
MLGQSRIVYRRVVIYREKSLAYVEVVNSATAMPKILATVVFINTKEQPVR